MTELERAVKIIDELVCVLWVKNDFKVPDYFIVEDALRLIAKTRKNNKEYPITLALFNYLVKVGYLDEND